MSNSIKVKKNLDGSCSHWCEGCNSMHQIYVYKSSPIESLQWVWNEDNIKPTFTPAIKHKKTIKNDGNQNNVLHICHYIIVNGFIRYFTDSSHQFAGKELLLSPYTG